MKKPGRRKLKCTQCGKPFSTHSTNRDVCHRCKPKCKEIHYFVKKEEVVEEK